MNAVVSTYFALVVLIVADVPKERQPTSEVIQPAPITSKALSAGAIRGRPAGMPVAAAASGVISPMTEPGTTSSGNIARSIDSACHFQSHAGALRCRLKSNGTYPTCEAVESTQRPHSC